jgi:hypothetical protein
MKEPVVGRMPVLSGQGLVSASIANGGLNLTLCDRANSTRTIPVDHAVCGKGYQIDIRRFGYVEKSLLERPKHVGRAPVLSTRF